MLLGAAGAAVLAAVVGGGETTAAVVGAAETTALIAEAATATAEAAVVATEVGEAAVVATEVGEAAAVATETAEAATAGAEAVEATTAVAEGGEALATGVETAEESAQVAEAAESLENSGTTVSRLARAGRLYKGAEGVVIKAGAIAGGVSATVAAANELAKYVEKGNRLKRLLGPSLGYYTQDWATHLADVNDYAVINAASDIRRDGGKGDIKGSQLADEYVNTYLGKDWKLLHDYSNENMTVYYNSETKSLVGHFAGTYSPMDFVNDAIINRSNARDRESLQSSADRWADLKSELSVTGKYPVEKYFVTGSNEGGKIATFVTASDPDTSGVVFNPLKMPHSILDQASNTVTKYLGQDYNKNWMSRMTVARVDGDRYSYGVLDDIEANDTNYTKNVGSRPVGQGYSLSGAEGLGQIINIPSSNPKNTRSNLPVNLGRIGQDLNSTTRRSFANSWQRSASSLDNFLTVDQAIQYNNDAKVRNADKSAFLAQSVLDASSDLANGRKPNEAYKGILTSVLRHAVYDKVQSNSGYLKSLGEDSEDYKNLVNQSMAKYRNSVYNEQNITDGNTGSTPAVTNDSHFATLQNSQPQYAAVESIKQANTMGKQTVNDKVSTGEQPKEDTAKDTSVPLNKGNVVVPTVSKKKSKISTGGTDKPVKKISKPKPTAKDMVLPKLHPDLHDSVEIKNNKRKMPQAGLHHTELSKRVMFSR